ncbi:MAG: SH3 domain-containing protein [Bacteroidales bacterium]|nr:SH3 domain-containing protein [Bacteroidales bacterium]
MRRSLIILFILVSLPASLCATEDPDSLFKAGSELYNKGDHAGALELWQEIADEGLYSPALYYNMGNAAFKIGKTAHSILWYEKALLMKPFDEDIRYNLEIARSYVTDRFDTIPELFVIRWFRMISLVLDSNGWAVIAVMLFALCLVLLLLWLFSGKPGVKRLTLTATVFSFALALSALGLYHGNRRVTIKKRAAVILTPAETGMSSPGTGGKELFVIHEGTKVKIEEEAGEWIRIRLPDGNVGWITSGSVGKI